MRIFADTNVPEEHVSALRGDGHEVTYTRHVAELGPEATDRRIAEYAEATEVAILSTDRKDFSNREASVAIFVAPQQMDGGEVASAIARIEAMSFDPSDADPIWLSSL